MFKHASTYPISIKTPRQHSIWTSCIQSSQFGTSKLLYSVYQNFLSAFSFWFNNNNRINHTIWTMSRHYHREKSMDNIHGNLRSHCFECRFEVAHVVGFNHFSFALGLLCLGFESSAFELRVTLRALVGNPIYTFVINLSDMDMPNPFAKVNKCNENLYMRHFDRSPWNAPYRSTRLCFTMLRYDTMSRNLINITLNSPDPPSPIHARAYMYMYI